MGLFYPGLLVINIVFVLLWILKRKKYFWLSLAGILLGLPVLMKFVQSDPPPGGLNSAPNNTSIKLLSYNVRLFDLYNWKDDKNRVTRDKIFDFLKKEDAGLICLQEFFSNDTGYFPTLDTIVKFQSAKFYHVEYTATIKGVNHWGIATFSKYPIVGKGKIKFDSAGNNICIYTDVKIGKDTLRVFNAHLGSVHFDYDEYDLMENINKIDPGYKDDKNRDSSGPLGNSAQIKKITDKDAKTFSVVKKMFQHLRLAFIKRAEQSNRIAENINSSPYPVIICGDFNDTPISYAYNRIANNLNDAFLISGKGIGRTYLGVFPSFRIDYILHDKSIKSSGFRTITSNNLSDHFPLSCNLEL